MWKTAFENFEVIWSAGAEHITSNFLKAVFYKFYLVRSWILCLIYVMLCAIWYHLYNLETVKNTHWGVLLFSLWVNCTYGTKSLKASRIWPKQSSKHITIYFTIHRRFLINSHAANLPALYLLKKTYIMIKKLSLNIIRDI